MSAVLLFYYFFVLVFGLCIGSFLNCVIYRLEKKKKMTIRSFCPKCKKEIKWYDLVPVLSFFILRGKCRYCKKKISWQYPSVELVTGLVFLLIFQKLTGVRPLLVNRGLTPVIDPVIEVGFLFFVSCFLIVIFVYDLKHYIIPDKVLFPAIAATFFYQLIFNFKFLFLNSLWAGLGASAFFLIIFLISGGKWMGFGDVKLAILLGLLLGWPSILTGMFLSFFFGAIISVILMICCRKNLKSEVPFAPFLIIGTFVAMFWGEQISQWYTGLFKIL